MNLDWTRNKGFVSHKSFDIEKNKKDAGLLICKKNFLCLSCKKQINVGEMYWQSRTCEGIKNRCLACRTKALDSL